VMARVLAFVLVLLVLLGAIGLSPKAFAGA
jgi:hypothetical protein